MKWIDLDVAFARYIFSNSIRRQSALPLKIEEHDDGIRMPCNVTRFECRFGFTVTTAL